MNFKNLLIRAKSNESSAVQQILDMYKPLLLKESVDHGVFDDDLFQDLCMTLLNCIQKSLLFIRCMEKTDRLCLVRSYA